MHLILLQNEEKFACVDTERHEVVPEELPSASACWQTTSSFKGWIWPERDELLLDNEKKTKQKKLAPIGNFGMPRAQAGVKKKSPPKPESNDVFVLRLPHRAAEPLPSFASAAG